MTRWPAARRHNVWSYEPPEVVTRCKHGPDPCERCGTTERRDARHTTVKGRGKVARALRSRR